VLPPLENLLALSPKRYLPLLFCPKYSRNVAVIKPEAKTGIAVVLLILSSVLTASASYTNYAPVPKTRQTECYKSAAPWGACPCGTTDCPSGQDGDLQMGVTWPNPRFTDNGDGTVTDNLTGLMWMKNADAGDDCDGVDTGLQNWNTALASCAQCNTNVFAGYTDWRLPNIRELSSLIDFSQFDPGLPDGHPFDVHTDPYWSSTTRLEDLVDAWDVDLDDGHLSYGIKADESHYVWPVRGESAPCLTCATGGAYAPVPKTGQTGCWDVSGALIGCAGTGQDGEYQMGIAWPSPRFTDNLDGTVTDNLTGLIWLKDADCPNGDRGWSDSLIFANSLFDGWDGGFGGGDCGLSDGSVAGDWRLPNVRELSSLIDFSEVDPGLQQ